MATKQPEDRLLSPAEVAEIWNERALKMGYKTNYSRESVTARRNKGKQSFVPDVVTPHMTLYKESSARSIPLHPKENQRIKPEDEEPAALQGKALAE